MKDIKSLLLLANTIIIFGLCFYNSTSLLKKNLNQFLNLNQNCEGICKNPIKTYEEKLLTIKKLLPLYGKVGFTSDTCKVNKHRCRIEYRLTRYFLYPIMLQHSTNFEYVIGLYDGEPVLLKRAGNDN